MALRHSFHMLPDNIEPCRQKIVLKSEKEESYVWGKETTQNNMSTTPLTFAQTN